MDVSICCGDFSSCPETQLHSLCTGLLVIQHMLLIDYEDENLLNMLVET